ncbi:hypothetical protein YPC_3836 [Yersinia pestis biovar Medievalis str. Harbin 35]|nr:hypothetical protein YPC_3836 [Yersinia pestis biovar Medievalis str. Harbin 35]EEO78387.1 hypothetical protein YP516_0624 [Yersinia pestis Nepal516]
MFFLYATKFTLFIGSFDNGSGLNDDSSLKSE